MAPLTTDARQIEQRLLELAYTTETKLTATALAYFAPCSIEDASKVLEALAARGQVTMDIEDDGAIVYAMPGRQKLGAAAPPRAHMPANMPATVAPPFTRALVPAQRRGSPAVAAVLSAVVPGAGHAYAGHALAAVLWFLVVGMGYALVLPGLLLHVWCMISAARKTLPAQPRPMLLVA